MPEPVRRSEALRALAQDPQEARFRDALVRAIQTTLAQGKAILLPGIGRLAPDGVSGAGGSPAVGLDGLKAEIASRGSLPPETVQQRLKTYPATLRRDLLTGARLTVPGLGTFDVRRERARIERHPLRGHRMVLPAQAEVRFVPLKELTDSVGGKKILFTPAEEFLRDLQTGRSTTILVAMPVKDVFADTVEYYFRSAGWTAEIHTRAEDVEKRFDQPGANYLLLLDSTMPDYQGLCRRLKSRKETGLTPILLIMDSPEKYDRPSELMVCGDEHIAQPFEVKKLLTMTDDEILRVSEEEALFLQQVRFQFPSTDEGLEQAADYAEEVFEHSGLPEESLVALKAAFREAIGNANQHGNKYDTTKKIEVLYLLDREKVTIVVQDQGPGFDHARYVQSGQGGDAVQAARKRHQEGRMGGLGIMLMLKCCDRLEYNHSGNAITLTKFIPKTPAAGAPAPVTAAQVAKS